MYLANKINGFICGQDVGKESLLGQREGSKIVLILEMKNIVMVGCSQYLLIDALILGLLQ